jgi:hypothetical protein
MLDRIEIGVVHQFRLDHTPPHLPARFLEIGSEPIRKGV